MMTPRTSLIGTITGWPFFSRFWQRALVFGIVAAIFMALAFFPQRYRASATLTPADPATLGLSGTLGQLGAINSVFGTQADVEVALRVATSIYTRQRVIDELHLTT